MTTSSTTLEMTRPTTQPFPAVDALRVEPPATRCLQQLWCAPRAAGPAAHASDQVCDTSCLGKLRLPPSFTPLID